MKCEEIQPWLTSYILEDLDEASMSEIRAHLEHCEGCRAVARDVEPTLDLLRDALAAPTRAPASLSHAQRARIVREGNPPEPLSPLQWVVHWRPGPAFTKIAATVVICLVLVSLLMPALKGARYKARNMMIIGAMVGDDSVMPAAARCEEMVTDETDDLEAPADVAAENLEEVTFRRVVSRGGVPASRAGKRHADAPAASESTRQNKPTGMDTKTHGKAGLPWSGKKQGRAISGFAYDEDGDGKVTGGGTVNGTLLNAKDGVNGDFL